jgi:hypothetical protein
MASKTNVMTGERETYNFQVWSKLLLETIDIRNSETTWEHYLLQLNLRQSALSDRLCGLVVTAPGYRSRGPGSIPSVTRFSKK